MFEVLWGKKFNQSSIQNAQITSAVGEEGRLTFRNAVAVLAVLFCLHSHNSFAVTDDTIPFNIPQQRADRALTQFAEQANLTLVFPFEQLKDKTANRLVGDYPIATAINLLLHNTGLTPRFSDQLVLTIASEPKGKRMNITNSSKRKTVLAGLVGLFAAGGMTQAVAQGGEAATGQSAIDEIIVTANKRSGGASIQDTAMSITAIGSDEIDRRSLVNMRDYLRTVPSVNFLDLAPGQNQTVIRGIGIAQFEQATVSTYFGEVPLTHPVKGGGLGGGSSTDLKLVDVERVEVLRGPQGTLYGSGSMGGTVRNIPVAPNLSQFEGKLKAGFFDTADSSDSSHKLEGVFNVPLIEDELALRVVAYRHDNAGYIDLIDTPEIQAVAAAGATTVQVEDDYNPHTYTGGRANLLWQASDELSFSLLFATQELEQDGATLLSNTLDGYNFAKITSPTSQTDDVDLANLTIEYDLGWASVTSSSSSFDGRSMFISDSSRAGAPINFGPAAATFINEKEGFVQELRLASQLDGNLQFIAGLYYEDFDGSSTAFGQWHGDPSTLAWRGTNPIYWVLETEQSLKQKALFGEVTYAFDSQWELTLGTRWFDYERVDTELPGRYFATGPVALGSSLSSDERGTTSKVNLSYTPGDNINLYAQWSEGFRLGFGQPLPTTSQPDCDLNNDGILDDTDGKGKLDPIVKSDRTSNFELGAKLAMIDKRLIVNTALFRTDWNDLPITIIEQSSACLGDQVIRINAGEARVQGVEIETQYQATENLLLSLSTSYLDTEFLDDGIRSKGERLPLSSRINANFALQYEFELSGYPAFVSTDYSYMGDYLPDSSFVEHDPLPSYGKWNLRTGMTIDQMSVELYGTNLSNQDAFTVVFDGYLGARVPPRVIGLDVTYSF